MALTETAIRAATAGETDRKLADEKGLKDARIARDAAR